VNFISDEDVERALDWLRTSAMESARIRAERLYLEEYTKSLRSILMKEHPTLSAAAQEREACADQRYIDHLGALKIAIQEDAKMQFLRAAAEAKLEAWRTMHATERAMKL
jgi:hypothetical protein